MKYCSRCLYPANHPLGITFDEQGVCSGCRVHEEKDNLDWALRLAKLQRLCGQYKSQKRTIHDCIIPVSGGRDSHFIVHVAKNILGLHPLLVSYNKQYNTAAGIRNLANLRTHFGCDFMQCTVSPERVRRVMRESIRRLGSVYWQCLAGQTAYPVHVAVKFKIPLIIWGAHQGIDQVGMFSHLDEVEMTRKYRKEHDLMGLEAEDLLEGSRELARADLQHYFYPHDKELEAVGVRGVYLNNFLRWDTKAQHELMIAAHGYEPGQQQRTFDTYNDLDCFHYSGLHDLIKFYKWGYGKITDHASREIRLKRLTREQGIALVERYQSVPPTDTAQYLDWLGMREGEFWEHINAHRSSTIWERAGDQWRLRDHISRHPATPDVEAARLEATGACSFHAAPIHAGDPKVYTIFGRGWGERPEEASHPMKQSR